MLNIQCLFFFENNTPPFMKLQPVQKEIKMTALSIMLVTLFIAMFMLLLVVASKVAIVVVALSGWVAASLLIVAVAKILKRRKK